MFIPEGESGLKNLNLLYKGDPHPPNDLRCCWQYQVIPEGKYINGIRVKTDDPSGKITRLDFLLGGVETETSSSEDAPN